MSLKFFLTFIVFFLFKSYLCFGLNNRKIEIKTGCNLEDYLLNFNQMEDYELQDDIINFDTLYSKLEYRYGYSFKVMGYIKLDTSAEKPRILVESVKIYSAPPKAFNDKGIELYFKNQFKEYIYTLTEKCGLKVDSLKNNCSFIILQRRYRDCG